MLSLTPSTKKGMKIKNSQQTHKVIFFLLEKDSQEIQKGYFIKQPPIS